LLIIGLTGGIASGKSTVSALFAGLGVPVIDADVSSRELVAPGQPALREIVARFGPEILLQDGSLNRTRLGQLIFADSGRRRQLEDLLHPLIRQDMLAKARRLQHHPYLLFVIPLLVETQQRDLLDRVLLVDCPGEVQLRRLMDRSGIGEEDARRMLLAQARREDRLPIADDLILNATDQDGSELPTRVEQLHQKYLRLALTKKQEN
jgi:dephospho-CoA kinase